MKPRTQQEELVRAVTAFAVRRVLLSAQSRILVALSGGPDSCALLLVLKAAAERGVLPSPIAAAHFHHGLRGTDADEDAAFSAELSVRMRIPCVIGIGAVQSGGRSPNDAARRFRYEFLTEAAQDFGANTIAVAHTADDQAETVLGRVLRGSGVDGLAGIPPSRVLAPGLTVVRPLLCLRRSEIESICAANGVVPRQDPSNVKDQYSRSRLRKRLPELEREFNPRLVEALGRLAENAALDSELLEERSAELLERSLRVAEVGQLVLDWAALREAHPALRRRVLKSALWRLAGDDPRIAEIATGAWIAYVDDFVTGIQTGIPNDLPAGIRFRIHAGALFLQRQTKSYGE